MKLQRREMILASVTGALLLVALVGLLFATGDSRSVAKLLEDRKAKAAEVEKKQELLDGAKRDAKRLAEWRRRALPATASPSDAPSLYQDWLLTLAKQDNIDQRRIDPKEPTAKRVDPKDAGPKHEIFSFTLHGQATLADLTKFLYDFYSAGHLHQIRYMLLKPREHSRELELTLTIEAMMLPDADRKDQLSKEPGHGLRYAKLDEYREPIVKRDLFAAYVRTDKKTVDPAEYTFVTGITEVNGTRQVWLFDRMAGKKWILGEGDGFQVGDVHGTVKTIASTREVTLEFDGHRRSLHEGDNLRSGEAVEPEKTEKKDKTVAEDPSRGPAEATKSTGDRDRRRSRRKRVAREDETGL